MYNIILVSCWMFFGAIWVGLILYVLIRIAVKWVNDQPLAMPMPKFLRKGVFEGDDTLDGIGLLFCSLVFLCLGFVLSLVWPLIIIVAIISVVLYSLRGFMRFKKTVNKALNLNQKEEN